MTLGEYLSILRRSWAWILAATITGAAAALGVSMLMTPKYQATAQMFVSVRIPVEKGYYFSGDMFASQRVASYLKVVDSPTVLEPVIEQLGLETTPKDLARLIDVKSPAGTVLFDVTATDPDPKQAARLANTIAASYAAEIERLEGSAAAQGKPRPDDSQVPVQVSVVKPAEVPEEPTSSRPGLNVVLGALLGFLVGAGIAVLRHSLDTSVKSERDLEEASGSTALGTVTLDPGAKTQPLATMRGSQRAEDFRSIRTNLQYADVDNPPHTVVVTSSVPGEGKTTTACNLAIALGQAGSRVLLVEGDLRRPKVAEYLGVDGSVGVTDILIGQAEINSSIVSWQRGLLDFLPSGAIPPNPSELLGSHQMAELLRQLRTRYDAIIIDVPPVLPVTDAAILAMVADGAILVARCGKTNREQIEHAADSLRQVHARVLGTVLNFAPSRRPKGYGHGYGYESPTSGDSAEGRRVLGEENMPGFGSRS